MPLSSQRGYRFVLNILPGERESGISLGSLFTSCSPSSSSMIIRELCCSHHFTYRGISCRQLETHQQSEAVVPVRRANREVRVEPEGRAGVFFVSRTHAGPGPGKPSVGHSVSVESVDVGVADGRCSGTNRRSTHL